MQSRDALKQADENTSKAAVGASPKLPGAAPDILRKKILLARNIGQCIELLDARAAAEGYLSDLETRADPNTREVAFGSRPVPFHVARLLATQGYLSVTWSIADKLATTVAELLCSDPAASFRNVNLFTTPHGCVLSCRHEAEAR